MIHIHNDPIEELGELVAVEYLSDLKYVSYERVRKQLRDMDPQKYSLPQWKNTAIYLTGNCEDLQSVEEIYAYLINYSDGQG